MRSRQPGQQGCWSIRRPPEDGDTRGQTTVCLRGTTRPVSMRLRPEGCVAAGPRFQTVRVDTPYHDP